MYDIGESQKKGELNGANVVNRSMFTIRHDNESVKEKNRRKKVAS